MVFLLLGEDSLAKDQKVDEIKKKYLPSQESLVLDYAILDGKKIDPATFKKTLLELPAAGKFRVVLLRLVHKLDEQNEAILIDFLNSADSRCILILDSENNAEPSLRSFAEVFSFSKGKKADVSEMTDAIYQKNTTEALKILSQLFEQGQYHLSIMGFLVGFWGKRMKWKVSAETFKKGLRILQEADLNIKRTRMDPEQAVETCVVKLCCLLTC